MVALAGVARLDNQARHRPGPLGNQVMVHGTGQQQRWNRSESVVRGLAGRASRQGRTLRLQLEGARAIRFVDCGNADSCGVENVRLHRLAAWWAGRGTYVVAVDGYAQQMAYLVRARDGLMVRTLAPPVLAPDERHAIATDLIIARGPGSTEVLDTGVDPPALVPFRPSTTCPALLAPGWLPRWIDDSTARFSDAMLPPGEAQPKELILRLSDGAAEWVCRH